MRKILFTTILFIGVLSANAQWYIGPQISANFCSISNVSESSIYPGFAIGAFGGYDIAKWFALEANLTVSTQGVKVKSSEEDVRANVKNIYVNIPVLAKFNVYKGIYAMAGPQVGLRVGNKIISEGTKYSAGEDYNVFDFGFLFAAGYQFDFGLRAGISYDLGLSRVVKGQSGTHNRVFAITVGYRF